MMNDELFLIHRSSFLIHRLAYCGATVRDFHPASPASSALLFKARIQMFSFAKELPSGNFVTFKIFRRLMSKVTFSPLKSQNRASCSEKTLER
jgi:hypothetical protein